MHAYAKSVLDSGGNGDWEFMVRILVGEETPYAEPLPRASQLPPDVAQTVRTTVSSIWERGESSRMAEEQAMEEERRSRPSTSQQAPTQEDEPPPGWAEGDDDDGGLL